jgi:hypothetical protein
VSAHAGPWVVTATKTMRCRASSAAGALQTREMPRPAKRKVGYQRRVPATTANTAAKPQDNVCPRGSACGEAPGLARGLPAPEVKSCVIDQVEFC